MGRFTASGRLTPCVVGGDSQRVSSPAYDLVVIGGGITGAGIARDAALRGLQGRAVREGRLRVGHVVEVEQADPRRPALPRARRDRARVRVGLRAPRADARRAAPGAAAAVPDPDLQGRAARARDHERRPVDLRLARAVPRAAAAQDVSRHARRRSRSSRSCGPTACAARSSTTTARPTTRGSCSRTRSTRAALGARLPHVHRGACGFERDGDGRITGVAVRDRLTGKTWSVPARAVVLAAGAWTDEMIRRFEIPMERPLLRRTKGVHIVLPRERLPLARAITLISPVDGRVMFAIPWRERTVLGTTDTDFTGTADEVAADADDVKYLCDSGNGYFPGANLTPDDVIATWAGPASADRGAAERRRVARSRASTRCSRSNDGLVIIAGGKLTTYRRMAREAVNKTLELLRELGETVDRRSATTTKASPAARRGGHRAGGSRGRRRDRPPADGTSTGSTSTPRRTCAASTARARSSIGERDRARTARSASASIASCRTCGPRSTSPRSTISRAPSRTCSPAACRCCWSSRDQGLARVRARGRTARRRSSAGTPRPPRRCSTSTRPRSRSAGAGAR